MEIDNSWEWRRDQESVIAQLKALGLDVEHISMDNITPWTYQEMVLTPTGGRIYDADRDRLKTRARRWPKGAYKIVRPYLVTVIGRKIKDAVND